ncbi:hypothetical protein P7K49_027486 [Saguinus oedipus]|uniref:Uncharacterized protein n=1 Tax=Saguinus oedipus TaxID=9490 RepID=A0ABQ9U9N0_SAGOE|nr:hypothetical protein P7K49_027486 [Saguinus oedipus]
MGGGRTASLPKAPQGPPPRSATAEDRVHLPRAPRPRLEPPAPWGERWARPREHDTREEGVRESQRVPRSPGVCENPGPALPLPCRAQQPAPVHPCLWGIPLEEINVSTR